jgi:hypothetical protein
MKNRFRNCSHLFLNAFVLSLLFGLQAQGRIYVVTDTNDTTEITSLRGAIIDANYHGGNNTIILVHSGFLGFHGQQSNLRENQQWILHLTISGADEDAARTGDLDITRGNLTISGIGSNVTIDATGLGDRVFQVSSNATLTLAYLTIIGGSTVAGTNGQGFYNPAGNGESGGCIYNAGTLNLAHCSISGNSCGGGGANQFFTGGNGGEGGGIFNSGKMALFDCVVSDNSSGVGNPSYIAGNGGAGGGIYNSGSMAMSHCSVSNNVCGAGGNNGNNCWRGNGGNGGGIYNQGQLFVNDCFIINNSAGEGGAADGLAGNGGGIANAGSSFLTRCIISGNSGGMGGGLPYRSITGGGPGGNGGGLCNFGNLTLTGCSISNNFAGAGANGGNFIVGTGGPGTGGGSGGSGGGVFNTNTLSLINCSVCGNGSGAGGVGGDGIRSFSGGSGGTGGDAGGIFSSGLLELTNCTISGNFCGNGGNGGAGVYSDQNGPFYPPNLTQGGNGGSGGGIYSSGPLELISCSIIDNTSGAGGTATITLTNGDTVPSNGIGGKAGGIFRNSGLAFCANTLVALNTTADNSSLDIAGNFTSRGFNLIGIADGSTGIVSGINADQAGSIALPIDPLIGPLQMNGGPTPTHALLPGSPAIDQGNSFGVHTDQRGHHRPYNYTAIPNAPGGDGSDIGAFELDNR